MEKQRINLKANAELKGYYCYIWVKHAKVMHRVDDPEKYLMNKK